MSQLSESGSQSNTTSQSMISAVSEVDNDYN